MMPNQNVNLDVSAKTVDEAIAAGLAQLGLTRSQVDIKVLNEGKRGLFGIGAEEAVVRLTVKTTPETVATSDEPAPAVSVAATASTEPQPETPAASPPTESDSLSTAAPAANDTARNDNDLEQTEEDIVRLAREHLETLLSHMGIEATVETHTAPELVENDEEAPIVLDIQGKDLGILIGRRSETLQALQYLVRLMASKDMGSWQRIVIDVESYRSRRRQSLQKMAHRMAERAVANHERVVLESMSAYERRIIHLTLRDHPAVITKSIGQDNNRKVTIIPK